MSNARDVAVEVPRPKQKRYLRTIFLPNSSPVPNWFFDEVLSDSSIPHATRSVLLFMLRKTVGWNNKIEELSLSEIERGAAVSRPSAIHAIRVICDCWGLFHKTRGRKGQYSSVFTIGDLTEDGFMTRGFLVTDLYGTLFPTAAQLREKPCTNELLREQRSKNDAERAREEAADEAREKARARAASAAQR